MSDVEVLEGQVELEGVEERLRELIDQAADSVDGQFRVEEVVDLIHDDIASDPELTAYLLRRGLHFVMVTRLGQRRHSHGPKKPVTGSTKWETVKSAVADGSLDLLAMPTPIANTGRWKPWGDWNFEDRDEDRTFHRRIFGAAGVRIEELDAIDEECKRSGKVHNRSLGANGLLAIKERVQQKALESGE